ncbi:MAG: hypothetical protein M3033_05555, partial [Acidobacteriota bacterium]|nr:hypothetical protein [Acidobacteriota bacterium]
MRNTVKIFSAFLGILLVLNTTASAKIIVQNGGWLRVIVTDAQNRVIAGAKCVLSQNKKEVAEVQTDATGTAIF